VLVRDLFLLAHAPGAQPCGAGEDMSSANKNSRTPPAIRNAGMLIPNASSSTSPASAQISRMTVLRTVLRIAASRLHFSEWPSVSAAKIGASPSGSTTTSSVTN
jgi:hypothetical protein